MVEREIENISELHWPKWSVERPERGVGALEADGPYMERVPRNVTLYGNCFPYP